MNLGVVQAESRLKFSEARYLKFSYRLPGVRYP